IVMAAERLEAIGMKLQQSPAIARQRPTDGQVDINHSRSPDPRPALRKAGLGGRAPCSACGAGSQSSFFNPIVEPGWALYPSSATPDDDAGRERVARREALGDDGTCDAQRCCAA